MRRPNLPLALPDSAPAVLPTPPSPARRRFLAQLGMLGAGSLILTGCSSGCSSRSATTSRHGSTPPRPEPPWKPPPPTTEPVVRVRVASIRPASSRGAASRVTIGNSGRWVRLVDADTGRMGVTLQSPLTVSRSATDWIIADRTGHRPSLDGLRPVEITVDDRVHPPFEIGQARYDGVLRLVASTESGNGDFDVVNHVPMESYLPGVLAKELFTHWDREAFAAQAVAARSYACVECLFHARKRHYDVTNTTSSQVYGGRTESAVAIGAVVRTRGLVLAFDGALVPGYYSSCCGGTAANAVDGIGPNPVNNVAPLTSRSTPDACTTAPVYRWRAERGVAEVSRRFAAWGSANNDAGMKALLDVRAIDVAETNQHGRPTKFRITDVRGREAVLPANRLIAAADFTGSGLQAPAQPLRSSFVTTQVAGSKITFSGRGYGHGVGLCQYCAQALAKRGVRHDEMLAQFYPGATVLGAYS